MNPKITSALGDWHPKMLRVEPSEECKKLAEAIREQIGRDVERCFAMLGLTKQDAAYRMGYSDPGVVSRWCSGTERPLFDKLFAIEDFEDAWILIRARRNPRVRVRTVMEFEERRIA